MILVDAVVAFVSGAAFEASCVAWVHYSEKNEAAKAAFVSMLIALANLAGVGESLHDLRVAPAFVLGYGLGTYATIKLKQRLTKSSPLV